MDAVRFGRALGVGARAAAKTLVTAADAATAQNPSAQSAKTSAIRSPEAPRTATPTSPVAWATRSAVQTAARTAAQAGATKAALRRGRKRFGQAALEPIVRLSGVVLLEVSGVFFGIFALVALGAAWRSHKSWRQGPGHQEFVWGLVMLAVFGYFCVNNFVRARRREKRR